MPIRPSQERRKLERAACYIASPTCLRRWPAAGIRQSGTVGVDVHTWASLDSPTGGAVITHEELLRQADALVALALKEAEARCSVLGAYVSECESSGARTAAWSDALRELRALQDHRAELLRRHR